VSATHNFDAEKILRQVVIGVQRGQAIAMITLQNELKLMLNRQGTGVAYRGGKLHKGMWRFRSAPGEPPAADTDFLKMSVQVAPVRRKKGNFYTLALTKLMPYAVHLEFGAPANNLKPRPFIMPSLRKVAPLVRDIMVRSIQKRLPGQPIT